MTTGNAILRGVLLSIVIIAGFVFYIGNNKYLEAEIVVEAHRDCMDRIKDGICCNMTPSDFIEYHKARRLLEGRR